MKKIILSLAVIFVVSAFTTTNKKSIDNAHIIIERTDLVKDKISNTSFVKGSKNTEATRNICLELGAAVLDGGSFCLYLFPGAAEF